MIEIKGKYNTAVIYTDVVDEAAVAQVIQLCNQEFTAGSRIRMMPDVHAGMGCTVGTTMTVTYRIVPSLVGVDIGCGMETVRLKETHIELQKLDKLIYSAIPSGFAIRREPHRLAAQADIGSLRCIKSVDEYRAMLSIGTLGGGNHFIEVDKGEDGALYLVIHSGSRRLGLEVAKYYQERAYRQCNGSDEAAVEALAARMKAEGQEKGIEKAVRNLKNVKRTPIPKTLCYVEGKLFDDYIHDMRLVQAYAALNRAVMADELIRGMGLHIEGRFTTIHNYLDTDAMILRKGAVSARAGERLLIPINMRDGSLVCTGKGNDEWNQSAPHGAGRLMNRGEAKQRLTLTQFKAEMEGIFSTSVRRDTIDESPMAYKTMEDIVSNIGPTVEIDEVIRPIYNFKAGTEEAQD